MIATLALFALVQSATGQPTAPPVIKPYGEVLLNYEMQCSSQDASASALKLQVEVVGEGSSRKAVVISDNGGLLPSGQYTSKLNFLSLMTGKVGDPLLYAEGFYTKDDKRHYNLDYFYQSGIISRARIEVWNKLMPGGKLTIKDRIGVVPLTCQQKQVHS